tara:strand:- start:1178 stop:1327 length:150 start_codon:yes stop_codon:yes gene_type:complete
MKIGDLVRHLSSESGMLGVIVGWHQQMPVVRWNDGRTNWVLPHLIKVMA